MPQTQPYKNFLIVPSLALEWRQGGVAAHSSLTTLQREAPDAVATAARGAPKPCFTPPARSAAAGGNELVERVRVVQAVVLRRVRRRPINPRFGTRDGTAPLEGGRAVVALRLPRQLRLALGAEAGRVVL